MRPTGPTTSMGRSGDPLVDRLATVRAPALVVRTADAATHPGPAPDPVDSGPRAGAADDEGTPHPVLHLQRLWPRGDGQALLDFATPGGGRIAGRWVADASERTALLRRLGRVAGPESVREVGEGVVLQAAGADDRLPALATAVARGGSTLVAHRPGRRAVVRTTGTEGTRYEKHVRPSRVTDLVCAGRRLTGNPGLATPMLHHTDDGGVTVWSELPGRTLHAVSDPATLTTAAHATGRALRILHDVGVTSGDPVHGPDREAAVVRAWSDRRRAGAGRPLPSVCLTQLERRLDAAVATAPVLVHRDFFDKQVVVDAHGSVGLLDLDTLAAGEAALDLANALVHLELRQLQGRWPRNLVAVAAAALVAGYAPDAATLRRIPAYAAATRLRLACVYALRPPWRHLPGSLVELVDEPVPGLPST